MAIEPWFLSQDQDIWTKESQTKTLSQQLRITWCRVEFDLY